MSKEAVADQLEAKGGSCPLKNSNQIPILNKILTLPLGLTPPKFSTSQRFKSNPVLSKTSPSLILNFIILPLNFPSFYILNFYN